ncbi:hypothetical protein ACF07D_11125 [Leucobacter sp. NPDC015123]|uniref:hypothetical protein n=1 Tax=Leucobacter sp. NPDC015123 TaxID=3364129 RepID=UPI0036F49775
MSTRDVPERVGDLPRIGRPATSALLLAGIASLAEVAKLSRAEVLSLHGVGPKAVRILEVALAEIGLTFKQ